MGHSCYYSVVHLLGFKNIINGISQHTSQGGQMGEPALWHGSKFLGLLKNHEDINGQLHV